MTPIKTVSFICAHCISCFKDGCSRGNWNQEKIFSVPQFGNDKECPLLKLEAHEPTEKSKSALEITWPSVDDTWRVCGYCQYGKSGKISMDDYHNHCMDCPCASLREDLLENAAEAAIS